MWNEFEPDTQPYSVTVKRATAKAVQVDIDGIKSGVWLPRSKVLFPADVERGAYLEVNIPDWIIERELAL